MEIDTNRLRLLGVIEFCIGFIIVIIFGPQIESGIPDETTLKVIARSVLTLLGIGIGLYGLIQTNNNSDKALVPIYFWFVVLISTSKLLGDIIFASDIVHQIAQNFIYYFELFAYISVAIPLVIAIRKEKSDIVPLFICFNALYLIETVAMGLARLLGGDVHISVIILRLIWSIGWLIYFICSKKLELVYPKTNRTSRKWAIGVVIIYSILTMFDNLCMH